MGWAKGKYEKGKQWATDKATAAKDWAAGKAQSVKDRFTGKGAGAAEGEAGAAGAHDPAAEGHAEPVVEHFSMEGESHELTVRDTGGAPEVWMASPNPGALRGRVNDEIGTQTTLIEQLTASPTPDHEVIAHHTRARTELQGILTWHDAEVAGIRAQHATLGQEGINAALRRLGDGLAARIVEVAARFRLKDFARRTFNVDEHLESIRVQVEDQIEKHADNPAALGDGMAYTAAAAEAYLGWVHGGGERHWDKVVTGSRITGHALDELNVLQRNGIDMTGERMYVRGRNVLEMCERAQRDPKQFLWDRGETVLREYVEDMDARGQRGNGRAVHDVKVHLGMK
jgi:hypothetical protein